MTYESYRIIGMTEKATISNIENTKSIEIIIKTDTDSLKSTIDKSIAVELQLPIIGKKKFWSSLGEEERFIVKANLKVGEVQFETEFAIADRSSLKHVCSLGSKDIEKLDALVDVRKEVEDEINPVDDIMPDPVQMELDVNPMSFADNDIEPYDIEEEDYEMDIRRGDKIPVKFSSFGGKMGKVIANSDSTTNDLGYVFNFKYGSGEKTAKYDNERKKWIAD